MSTNVVISHPATTTVAVGFNCWSSSSSSLFLWLIWSSNSHELILQFLFNWSFQSCSKKDEISKLKKKVLFQSVTYLFNGFVESIHSFRSFFFFFLPSIILIAILHRLILPLKNPFSSCLFQGMRKKKERIGF